MAIKVQFYNIAPEGAILQKYNVVTKYYNLYFGSCNHIGTRRCLRYSFRVIMFGVRSETPCPSETCVVYIKRDVVGVSGFGKK